MLTRETISLLVNCELPAETIRQMLLDLRSDLIDITVLSAFIESIKETAAFRSDSPLNALDCSGTGGSGLPHFNTSTTVAFVLAAGGVPVAKFGNRAARSLSGSFDFLEALGIPAEIPFQSVDEVLDDVGVVFLYAPQYYPALAKLAPIRRTLPGASIFNSIGPLLHPLNPAFRLMGVSDPLVFQVVSDYLAQDKMTQSAIVVRSESGLDEFDPCASSRFLEVRNNAVIPSLVGARLNISVPPDVMTAQYNHQVFRQLIEGSAAPYFVDLVCLNAAAGFKAYGKVSDIEEGARLAVELVAQGAVKEKFEQCRRAYAKFID